MKPWGGGIRHFAIPIFAQDAFSPKRQKAENLHAATNCGHLRRSRKTIEIGAQ